MGSSHWAAIDVPIERLAARPDLATETAALMTATWPGHYGPAGEGDALDDVQRRIAEDRAAIALQDDAVVGTVAISDTSFGAHDEGPWLVGLCTSPAVRGQGIATALTTWAMGKVRQRGDTALYTTTREAAGIVERLGWRKLRNITDDSGTWSIWMIALGER